ncbi:MAG: hypothetical protein QW575_06740, partial [Thermoproteota archaeon]
MAKMDGEKFSYKDGKYIYYKDIEGLQERLNTTKKQKIGIDEGYFAALSAKAQEKKVKDFLVELTASRSNGHFIIINFVKIDRAAKMLLEIADYWMHGPAIDWAIFLARDREFTGDDPWEIEELMKAKGRIKKRNLLLRNTNFIDQIKIRPIPQKEFDKYEAEKDRVRQRAKAEKIRESYKNMIIKISNELYDSISANEISEQDVPKELAKRGYAPLIVSDIENELQKLILAAKFYKTKNNINTLVDNDNTN